MSRPQEIKQCCAAAYGSDVMALLLGESYHPGGLALTRNLATLVGLRAGQRVVDVAAGRGTTALLLASEYGVSVDGVDYSTANVATASGAASHSGLADRVRFHLADAERLPFPDNTFDAALCECALCTFPDKARAVAELARVLRPGGRVGISDVTADPEALPAELAGVAGWVACVADARPLDRYARLLEDAGLAVRHTETHDAAMLRMIDQIQARLAVAAMTARAKLEELGVQHDRAAPVLDAARHSVAAGTLGYGVLVAEKPTGEGT